MYNIKHKNKTPVREMDVFKAILLCIYLFWLLWRHPFFLLLNYFSRLLFHVTGTTPWILKSITAELYSSYFIIAYFYPSFTLVSTVSEANSGTLVFTMQYLVIYGTPSHCQWSPDASQSLSQGGGEHPHPTAHIFSLHPTNLITLEQYLAISKSWVFWPVMKSLVSLLK